ncbi:DUF3750 domain-containing protein [Pantoea ananatis]
MVEHRGLDAQKLIPQIEAAINPAWPTTYRAPGPGRTVMSMAHTGSQCADLKLDLPANALGKDYRPLWRPGLPPSGRGVQVKRRTKNAKAFHDKCEN